MAYRIDDRTAVSLLPAPRTTGLGQPGFFTAGDPQTGEGATVVTDTWLNMVQEELAGVVLGAGLGLNKTDNSQLLAAIRLLIAVETVRSQNAEAALLPQNNPAVQGTLTVGAINAPGNGGSNISLLYGPDLSSRLALQTDGNTVIYKNGLPFFLLNQDGLSINGQRLATAGDVASEAARAQAAEASLLPQNNPAVQGTLTVGAINAPGNGGSNISLLYGPDLSSRLALQTDGNTVIYKNGLPFFLLNQDGLSINGQRVATTGDVATEAARAQAAEAALLPQNNPAVQGTLTVGAINAPGNGSVNLVVSYGPALGQRLLYQSDGNLVFYQGRNAFCALSPTGFSYNGQRVATTGDVAAEAARAQAAEASLLPQNNPAVQGTLTVGAINAPGNGSVNLAVSYGPDLGQRLLCQNDGNLVFYQGGSAFCALSPTGFSYNGQRVATTGDVATEAARAQAAEAGLQPAGNYVTAGNRGPVKTYNFSVSASHGQQISFPDPFSGDDVAVVPVAQDTGGNALHIASWFQKNRNGFQLSLNVWTGSTFANEHNSVPVSISVTGPA